MAIVQTSLFLDDEIVVDKPDPKKLINKINNPKKVDLSDVGKALKSKKVSIEDKIELIKTEVDRILGHYKDETICLRSREELHDYITKSIENGILAVDTETNNTLDTIDGKIMGLCLYTPGLKNAYAPVNHIDIHSAEYTDTITPEEIDRFKLVDGQVTTQDIYEELSRLGDTKLIFHNAIFDMEVIKSTCGILLEPYWDTSVGAKLLDENELAGLKSQYILHINPEQEKYNIEKLFTGLPYAIFDPELFALYAATDSKITYELYKWQKEKFELSENKEVYELFKTIEMPILMVVAKIELTGVKVDTEYAKKMSIEYHKISDEIQSRIDKEMENLKPKIDRWKLTKEANEKPFNETTGKYGKSKVEQLADPIELGSSTQLAILLYDIIGVPVVDKKKPRTTDKGALNTLAEEKHIKICELMLEKREVDILINTFIDAIPNFVAKDGRVHAKFNTCGTQTGRFSSERPNLQQIPSHDKTIRMIFEPTQGYSITGGDFSGQEPRSLCSFAQDKEMQAAYAEKKDLYAVIASKCYHNNYTDNLEFQPQPDGSVIQSQEGKERRSKAKTIFLGVSYGMGPATLAERMNLPLDEAKQIIDEFYKGFPDVARFTKESEEMAKKVGYVTDLFGRRRHLPDALLPEYEIKSKSISSEFNPLIGAVPHEDLVLQRKIDKYVEQLKSADWKTRESLKKKIEAEGFTIRNNGSFIAKAARQTLNARIQGSAASMTKLAMIMIDNDEELNRLGFRLLATIHDEVFGEAPTENSDRAAERLSEVMVEAAKVKCSFTNWSVDCYNVKAWYEDENVSKILETYKKNLKKMNEEEAFKAVCEKFPMYKSEGLKLICDEKYTINGSDIELLK